MEHIDIMYLKGSGSVFRAIKRFVYTLVEWSIILILPGCFLYSVIGPGYAVDIEVNANKELKIKDIAFLENIIIAERFMGKRITSADQRECVYFIKDEPQIQIGYCYDRDKKSLGDDVQIIKNFRLLISNYWKGQTPAIKQEIDRLAEIFYKELVTQFGAENTQMEKRRTGPPF